VDAEKLTYICDRKMLDRSTWKEMTRPTELLRRSSPPRPRPHLAVGARSCCVGAVCLARPVNRPHLADGAREPSELLCPGLQVISCTWLFCCSLASARILRLIYSNSSAQDHEAVSLISVITS
jgi:hypothetical protein